MILRVKLKLIFDNLDSIKSFAFPSTFLAHCFSLLSNNGTDTIHF
jgi:hypothetical protein